MLFLEAQNATVMQASAKKCIIAEGRTLTIMEDVLKRPCKCITIKVPNMGPSPHLTYQNGKVLISANEGSEIIVLQESTGRILRRIEDDTHIGNISSLQTTTETGDSFYLLTPGHVLRMTSEKGVPI